MGRIVSIRLAAALLDTLMVKAELQADLLLNTAEDLLDSRLLDLALSFFDKAEVCGADPDRCAAGRWMAAMLQGDFSAAWRESDAIQLRGTPDERRVWQGEDLAGKRVIVRCLHGFGDIVQFVRYAAMLNQLAAAVIWEMPPDMLQIASSFRAVDHVITWGGEYGRDWDVQVEVTELPYIFRTTVANLPIATRYIPLPREIIRRIGREIGSSGVPRIGVVWTAGAWNPSRSIPFSALKPIFEVPGCEFWNLQGGPSRYLDTEAEGGVSLRDSPACDNGILCLAGVISQLDLVVTVDTLAAHLAGALGVPVWLMLQYAADWRWMAQRDDSPWYPSMRIFRQPRPGAWKDVVDSVAKRLEIWLLKEQRRLA
jgi:hypothetical protein